MLLIKRILTYLRFARSRRLGVRRLQADDYLMVVAGVSLNVDQETRIMKSFLSSCYGSNPLSREFLPV